MQVEEKHAWGQRTGNNTTDKATGSPNSARGPARRGQVGGWPRSIRLILALSLLPEIDKVHQDPDAVGKLEDTLLTTASPHILHHVEVPQVRKPVFVARSEPRMH